MPSENSSDNLAIKKVGNEPVSLEGENARTVLVDSADTSETWEEVGAWLNIPLIRGQGSMFEQISAFLQANTVASGQETIRWFENFTFLERVVPTADIIYPRNAYMGIPTTGWWLLHYSTPDGSGHVEIIAERENVTTIHGEETTGAGVKFTKARGSNVYSLDALGYHIPSNQYISRISWPPSAEDIGYKLSGYAERGSTDAMAFHVYNRLPSLVSGQSTIVSK